MNTPEYDAVIVLGGSLNDDGTIQESNKERLKKAADLLQEGRVGAIITCGSHGYKHLKEIKQTQAEAYASYLESLGVSRQFIFLENTSQETLGNVLFVKMNILLVKGWRKVLVIPTYLHSTERIEYILRKILGEGYIWHVLRVGQSLDSENAERERKSLNLTQEINDQFVDGDHDAIYRGLMETHPAYGGTKWTLDELRDEMKH